MRQNFQYESLQDRNAEIERVGYRENSSLSWNRAKIVVPNCLKFQINKIAE